MSNKYNKVKEYYEKGYWNIAMCRNAVKKGWITAQEYEEITGEPYETK